MHLSEAEKLLRNDPKVSKVLRELRLNQIDAWLAQVRGNLCRIYREVGATEKSIFYGESSLFRRRKLGNPKEIIKGLNALALIYSRAGDIDRAFQLLQEGEDLLQNVLDPILEGRIKTNKATLLYKRDQFSDLLAKHTKKMIYAATQKTFIVSAFEIGQAEKMLIEVTESLIRTNSRELATAHHNLGELELLQQKYTEAMISFREAVRIAKIKNDKYTLLNSLQRLVLTAYLKGDVRLLNKFIKEFWGAKGNLKSLEETARYVMRYYITVGNFYYDKLFYDNQWKNFNKNFKGAFQNYTEAIAYAHRHAESSAKFAHNIFAERMRELLKFLKSDGREISQNIRRQLFQNWQTHKLDKVELQRYFGF